MRQPREVLDNTKAADWLLAAEDSAEIDRIFAEESVPTYVKEGVAV